MHALGLNGLLDLEMRVLLVKSRPQRCEELSWRCYRELAGLSELVKGQ